MNKRYYSLIDQALIQLQRGLTTLCADVSPMRANPAAGIHESILTPAEQRCSAALMRVNHAGEVCAQALYYGQMSTTASLPVKEMLKSAAEEETDHLAWTEQRIKELHSHTSYLNCFWYFNSYILGMVFGLTKDSVGLGFVEETERQVSQHLRRHLSKIPAADLKSRTLIAAMQADEERHGSSALRAGAKELPWPIKKAMAAMSKVMTTLSFWL